jgi:potassium voltage-gated channel Eag-related subfamily H protein 7
MTTAFYVVDFIFFIDMILTFFTSITDPYSFEEVTSKKIIAKSYLSLWFWVDFVSILPFDALASYGNESQPHDHAAEEEPKVMRNAQYMARIVRFAKIGKIIRLMRLLKIFKIMKNSGKLKAHFGKSL